MNQGKFEDAWEENSCQNVRSTGWFSSFWKEHRKKESRVNDFIAQRSTLSSISVPFKASRTDIFPEEPEASAGTSTSSAGATGELGSSPSDYGQHVSRLELRNISEVELVRVQSPLGCAKSIL